MRKKTKNILDCVWFFMLWMIIGCFLLMICLSKDLHENFEIHYIGKKVNVMTESWLKEYRVHSEEKDMYNTIYRLSNDEYWVYESCIRWADWLYIPCPNLILVTQEELETMLY